MCAQTFFLSDCGQIFYFFLQNVVDSESWNVQSPVVLGNIGARMSTIIECMEAQPNPQQPTSGDGKKVI